MKNMNILIEISEREYQTLLNWYYRVWMAEDSATESEIEDYLTEFRLCAQGMNNGYHRFSTVALYCSIQLALIDAVNQIEGSKDFNSWSLLAHPNYDVLLVLKYNSPGRWLIGYYYWRDESYDYLHQYNRFDWARNKYEQLLKQEWPNR